MAITHLASQGRMRGEVLVERDMDRVRVVLSGVLDLAAVPLLRAALLAPVPLHCLRVEVDAGGVTCIDDEALAVLFAAVPWTLAAGARLGYISVSEELDILARSLEVEALVPRG
ncbi:MAG: STAS domain-containing protein [Frankiaceae bacterium]